MCACLWSAWWQAPYDVHVAVPGVGVPVDLEVRFASGRVHTKHTLPGLGGVVPSALVAATGRVPTLVVRDMPGIASATMSVPGA